FPTTPPHPSSTLFPYTTLFRSANWESNPVPRTGINNYSIGTVIGRQLISMRGLAGPSGTCFGHLWDADPVPRRPGIRRVLTVDRSEEHTSELQSLTNLVCRLLL